MAALKGAACVGVRRQRVQRRANPARHRDCRRGMVDVVCGSGLQV